MGLFVTIFLSALGATFVAGGIVVYRKSERTIARAFGAVAIAAGLIIVAIVLFITPMFQPTSNAPEDSVEYTTPVNDYDSLLHNLNTTGSTVDPDGRLTQPFFSLPGEVIQINGSDIEVFEYPGSTSGEAEAAFIIPDDSSTGTNMVG